MLLFKNRWHRNYFIRRYLYGPMLASATTGLYWSRFLIPCSGYSLRRPIFIVGVSRSGTTVFANYLRRHRDLCDWSEAAQILESDFYNQDIDTVRTEDDVTPRDAFRIRFLFGAKTLLTGKSRFLNKHPENSLRIRFIKKLFPDAIFIHLIRNGWPTVVSNYRRTYEDPFRTQWPFGQFPKPPLWRSYLNLPLIEQFAHQWVDIIEYVRARAQECLGASDYVETRYEAFCERPHAVLQALDDFCSLPRQGRKYEQIPEALKSHNFRWRSSLSEDQAARVAAVITPLNRALGYDDWHAKLSPDQDSAPREVKA